ncbi:MAG: helix-turn-helix transcriptional regulator [Selenomonadaceae bacterium]|nr:helix-turn-helix transcriptional regulator [Selenomonadaceae bacterium]
MTMRPERGSLEYIARKLEIAKRIRRLRDSLGLSAAETARKLCMSASGYKGYESCEKNRIPPWNMLIRMALLFGTTIDYILGLDKSAFGGYHAARLFWLDKNCEVHEHGKKIELVLTFPITVDRIGDQDVGKTGTVIAMGHRPLHFDTKDAFIACTNEMRQKERDYCLAQALVAADA